eukprot:4841311-Pyramimonas_sp.AAC.1
MRRHLTSTPGPAHKWTKPRGWKVAQVRTSKGLSSFPGDIAEAQRDSWETIWDGDPEPVAHAGA